MSDVDFTFKLCIFGEGGVGKTTLTNYYVSGTYDPDTKMSMGAKISQNYINIDEKKVALQIWDFGGEESFRFLLPKYSKDSHAGIFIFDLTRQITLEKLDEWIGMFKHGLEDDIESVPILMVGSKQDLSALRSTTMDYAEKLSKTRNLCGYIECSAKMGYNIEYIFKFLIRKVMEIKGLL